MVQHVADELLLDGRCLPHWKNSGGVWSSTWTLTHMSGRATCRWSDLQRGCTHVGRPLSGCAAHAIGGPVDNACAVLVSVARRSSISNPSDERLSRILLW